MDDIKTIRDLVDAISYGNAIICPSLKDLLDLATSIVRSSEVIIPDSNKSWWEYEIAKWNESILSGSVSNMSYGEFDRIYGSVVYAEIYDSGSCAYLRRTSCDYLPECRRLINFTDISGILHLDDENWIDSVIVDKTDISLLL